MRKALGAVLGVVLVVFATPTPAGAVPPIRETSHDEFDLDLGSGICGFPLLAHVTQTVTRTTFLDADGDPTGGLLTGPITVVFTNGNTGASARLSIPGPTFFDADGNPVRGTGSWAIFTSDGEFVWAAGNLVFDSDGNASSITGTSRPICDLVAPAG